MKQIDNPKGRSIVEEPLEGELLNAIIDVIDALLIVLDPEGRIVRFNRACETLTNYESEEVCGKFFWDFLLPAEEISIIKKVFDNLDDVNFPQTHENYWLTRSGEKRLISWSNRIIKNARNEVVNVVGTGIDVTEQREAENSLRESYNLLRTVIEGTSDAIYVKDKSGRYQLINSAGAAILGKPVEEIIGLDDTVLFEEQTARRIIELDKRVIESGAP
jgi:PAS domain S-box-containing protein